MSISVNFRIKNVEKVERKKIYRLKIEFYNTDRKTKNVFKHVFTRIDMPTNLIRFCEKKKKLETALEYFASIDGHSGIVLM